MSANATVVSNGTAATEEVVASVVKETKHYIVVREVRSTPQVGTGWNDHKEHKWEFSVQQVLVKDPDGTMWEGIRFIYYKDGVPIPRPPVFEHGVVIDTILKAIDEGILKSGQAKAIATSLSA